MRLGRRERPGAVISLVPMIDVLMILLVFFMVTSTYLDLDMVPLAGAAGPGAGAGAAEEQGRLLVRIDAAGRTHLRGRPLAPDELAGAVAEELARDPEVEVIVLPSPQADVQALATAMDAAAGAGARRLRIVRLEAGP